MSCGMARAAETSWNSQPCHKFILDQEPSGTVGAPVHSLVNNPGFDVYSHRKGQVGEDRLVVISVLSRAREIRRLSAATLRTDSPPSGSPAIAVSPPSLDAVSVCRTETTAIFHLLR